MGLIIGPTSWWALEVAAACPVGTTLPDGSTTFCKAGGTAWIVSPFATQVSSQWANGKYNGIDAPGTDACCICDWSSLCTQLISCGFNPCDWFVPSQSQLVSLYTTRGIWTNSCTVYWSSREDTTTEGCNFDLSGAPWQGAPTNTTCRNKSFSWCVRAIRCVTY